MLHKNPANIHQANLPFGHATVFYPTATDNVCTACLVVSVNPVELVRGSQQAEEYVNDRPYVASSYLAVALNRVFGSALAGNCANRPELVNQPLPLTLGIPVVRAAGAPAIFRTLFEPLGYRVEAEPLALDPLHPEWGQSNYFRLSLSADVTVHDALSHVYVLLPALDGEKHYFIGEAEVEKLLRHGEGWLAKHPARDVIVGRYLRRRPSLIDDAMARLLNEENPEVEDRDSKITAAAGAEKELERPLTLHTQRLNLVATRLKERGAKSVLDLGCGEGKLVRRLLADRSFERIAAMDVSHRSLEIASSRLRLERMPERQRKRINLFQGSLLYRDQRLAGFDAAVLVEVIEHLDPSRLAAMDRVLFEFARPRLVLVTTPNREYNALFEGLPPGRMRHADHRFEWTRAEFLAWASYVADRFGYDVTVEPVGPLHAEFGAPSQLAIFSLQGAG